MPRDSVSMDADNSIFAMALMNSKEAHVGSPGFIDGSMDAIKIEPL